MAKTPKKYSGKKTQVAKTAKMQKKRRRPRRRPKKRAKLARLHIRLTREQHAAYCLAAERGGFDDLSVWVRLVLDMAAVSPLRYDAYRKAAGQAGFLETPRWILSILDAASGLTPSPASPQRELGGA
jgi:hypothetical protein